MGEIAIKSALYSTADIKLTLKEVWDYQNSELSELGNKNIEFLSSAKNEIEEDYQDLCWTLQAILEFQDLQSTIIPQSGQFLQQNYCYYESINVLREACLSGLNCCLHTSFSGLRSSLELILMHLYWKQKMESKSTHEIFYEWLFTGKHKPNFANLLLFIGKKYNYPINWDIEKRIKKTYSKLCSYSHTPLLNESLTSMKMSNVPGVSENVLNYWVLLLHETAEIILRLLIIAYPMCLFPVDTIVKFGFNTPVGAFFDKFNYVPLKRALGEKMCNEYGLFYKTNIDVVYKLEWFNSRPNLELSEILSTWSENEEGPIPRGISSIEDSQINSMIAQIKAKLRVISLGLTYSAIGMKVENYSNDGIKIINEVDDIIKR